MSANNVNFIKNSFHFRILILIILFSSNSFAQELIPLTAKHSDTIFLEKGVTLFSADKGFNQQITDKKIVLQNANLSSKVIGKTETILVTAIQKYKIQSLSQQVKAKENQKGRDVIRRLNEKISQYQAQSKTFDLNDFEQAPTPYQFFSSYAGSKNCIASNYPRKDFSKIYIYAKNHTIKRALDSLQSQQFTLYNNKSLDFCFTEIFSVRPPPRNFFL